jgi:hypothetical protein
MALIAAYANLQLDPDDRPRLAAFTEFCWQHILEYVSSRWIAEVRGGKIRLQQRTRVSPSGQSCSVFNDSVDDMVFSFVASYAALIWPLDEESREHLTSAKRLGSYVGEILATPESLTITRKKENEMRECNAPITVETSTVESVIGCRVRSYLTQLLVSDYPVPLSQSFAAADLLQEFLDMSQATSPKAQRRQYFSSSVDVQALLPTPTRKRRRTDSIAAPSDQIASGHSNGLVRLRFTFSGTRRLQRMLFCPSRPTAVLRRKEKAATASLESNNNNSSDSVLGPQQQGFTTDEYQCWLRGCNNIFQTTEDLVDHVQREHPAKHRHRMEAAISSIATTNGQLQHATRVSERSRRDEPTLVEDPDSIRAREDLHASLMKSQQASQDLHDAMKRAMAFDSTYAARFANVP